MDLEKYLGKSTLEKLAKAEAEEPIVQAVEEVVTAKVTGKKSLDELKTAPDYEVLAHHTEGGWHDGPRYVGNREFVGVVKAFGKTWERRFRWIDKGRGTREVWFVTYE